MGLQKNTASQKWMCFAFNSTTNAPVTGDAANITAKIRKDYGTAAATNDVNPTELESGYYEFDLTQDETNADVNDLIPVSGTANVVVLGVPGRSFNIPPDLITMGYPLATQASVDALPTLAEIMAGTGDTGITLAKVLEMSAAFMAGKVSASSVGGVTTYTYKKRDGTTTSFTSLANETGDVGTRNTTGSLS